MREWNALPVLGAEGEDAEALRELAAEAERLADEGERDA